MKNSVLSARLIINPVKLLPPKIMAGTVAVTFRCEK